MRFDDRIVGLAIVLLALGVIYESSRLEHIPGSTYGPGLMPTLIGIALAGLGAKIALAGIRSGSGHVLVDVSNWNGQTRGLVAAGWAVFGLIAGLFLMPTIGFPIFGIAFALPLMLLMRARPLVSVVTSLVIVAALQFVFGDLFMVPLATGPLHMPW